MRVALLLIGFFLFTVTGLSGQPAEERIPLEDYVNKWKDVAVRHMHQHKIPASITLAQGILESGYGNSPLARYANNHFGIKCHGWGGRKFYKNDDHVDDCFRKYFKAERSYADHADFLTSRDRYSFLFDLRTTDYKAWAKGLKKAGYATDPQYPERLIELIQDHELHRFDKVPSMKKKTPKVVEKERRDLDYARKRGGRKVYRHSNSVDMVRVQEGDSFEDLSKDLGISRSRLLDYNDMNPSDRISSGDTLYITPKRNWSRVRKNYLAKEGESMWEIAHRFGLKLEELYERNNMIPGTSPEARQKIILRGSKDSNEGKAGFFQRLFGESEQ